MIKKNAGTKNYVGKLGIVKILDRIIKRCLRSDKATCDEKEIKPIDRSPRQLITPEDRQRRIQTR